MEKKIPLDQFLTQINDMIQMIFNYKGSISDHLTPQIVADLEKLEKTVMLFNQSNQKIFESQNIDIHSNHENLVDDSSDEQRLVKRAKQIEKDAQTLQLGLTKAKQQRKREKKIRPQNSQGTTSKQQMKERRKLFKPLGGDKNWLPL